jgi:hypothetical protein
MIYTHWTVLVTDLMRHRPSCFVYKSQFSAYGRWFSSAKRLYFHVWLISPGVWFLVCRVDVKWLADSGPSDSLWVSNPAAVMLARLTKKINK